MSDAALATPLRHISTGTGLGGRKWYATRAAERPLAALAPVCLLLLWEGLVRFGVLDARFFPAPTSILGTFYYLIAEAPWARSLPNQILVSLIRVMVGFVIGAIPGIVIGT